MDLLKNPFHILGATPRDNRSRIMDLADTQSLLSDPDECREARAILTNPRNRVAAEVAWLPGVDPALANALLERLRTPNQSLLNTSGLMPIARANLFVAGFSHLPNLEAANVDEWILVVAEAAEAINPEIVYTTLNADRKIANFPEITASSVIRSEIQNQKKYYSQILSKAIENLSIPVRAQILTRVVGTATGNGNHQCPALIENLVISYELRVQDTLKKKQNIIETQCQKLRTLVGSGEIDTVVTSTLRQLLNSLKEWDALAQPIQLTKKTTGQRHDDSSKIADNLRNLAIDLFNEYHKYEISSQIVNTLQTVFAEVPEIAEAIDKDIKALKENIPYIKSRKSFEEIERQTESIKAAVDSHKPDYTVSPLVNQLINTLKTWNVTTHTMEVNDAAALTVRNLYLHLWNEHKKINFAIQITNTLVEVFANSYAISPEGRTRLNEDKQALEKQKRLAESMETFEEIERLVKRIKETVDTTLSASLGFTLPPMVNELINALNKWNPSSQDPEINDALIFTVRNIGIDLWNKHEQLNFAKQIINALVDIFVYSPNVSLETQNRLKEDKTALDNITIRRPPDDDGDDSWGNLGCWVVFIIVIVIIVASRGC